jgi:hypothetical protein
MASDPILAPSFVWDAQRLYKFDGTSYVRFYTEPWTGNRLWDVQVGSSFLFSLRSLLYMLCSHRFLKEGNLLVSFYTPIKLRYHHLEL